MRRGAGPTGRGWFFGAETFEEKLLGVAERALKKSARRKNDKAAAEVRDHARARAEALVRAGMRIWGLDEEALRALPRGERRKALIALVVKAETAAPLDWVAARFDMGARSTGDRRAGESLAKGTEIEETARQDRCSR